MPHLVTGTTLENGITKLNLVVGNQEPIAIRHIRGDKLVKGITLEPVISRSNGSWIFGK